MENPTNSLVVYSGIEENFPFNSEIILRGSKRIKRYRSISNQQRTNKKSFCLYAVFSKI